MFSCDRSLSFLHYSGFMANDGKYYLMRMSDDMAFAFDEIGADGIFVDEDVVFE